MRRLTARIMVLPSPKANGVPTELAAAAQANRMPFVV
jgi:hypothetical protein